MDRPLRLSQIQSLFTTDASPCTHRVQNYLNAIDQKAHLNAFLGVYAEEALSQAQVIDKKIASGQSGKLAGLVVGIKDVFAHRNHPLQAASRMLQGFHSQYSATVIQRLIDEDAVIIGRQNCDEFGMGSSTENSAFGPVLNPIDPSRSPGGSSGGSAAAVAAGLCDLSLGSDTGGSVRQPAAFCG
ncbi:MAG: Asp-tRNA(Asn)/Glu-tRNA(Gln) amidotransferase subunit GatA, partial [Cyclobacteriaceae bacterium]|nr:Asp-tRNA(Asn)/Glu-tRNA(Gln) amidotransferase subunit GatA [Cyclobacteriaceae bacterium]